MGLGRETRNHQAYLLGVDKRNEPAVEVVVVLVGVFVVVLVVVVPVLVVALPACTIIHTVTFPHASATGLWTKKIT